MLERNHKVGWFKYYFPEPSGAMAHGRLTANFNSLEEVSVWVKAWNEHGENGELMLRIWLAREAKQKESREVLQQSGLQMQRHGALRTMRQTS